MQLFETKMNHKRRHQTAGDVLRSALSPPVGQKIVSLCSCGYMDVSSVLYTWSYFGTVPGSLSFYHMFTTSSAFHHRVYLVDAQGRDRSTVPNVHFQLNACILERCLALVSVFTIDFVDFATSHFN